ncbi:UrcA family protein [Sphingomonas jinjuensis]|uniref:UrcA family protein n=1 Tax=Sphingomonas jinjuensis TaxID=535907 RepID=A0A840FHW3_9SPHN|nr:UrcA family protein [Sphingomonas jinjuensis]MBB4152945.1 UrcA family protein [Sphingomonas jinjuensis]
MNSLLRAAIAAVIVTSAATPVLAEREMVSVHVSRAGLDLGQPADRARMMKRVRRAAAFACRPVSSAAADYADAQRCRREMSDNGDAAIARLAGSRTAMDTAAN